MSKLFNWFKKNKSPEEKPSTEVTQSDKTSSESSATSSAQAESLAEKELSTENPPTGEKEPVVEEEPSTSFSVEIEAETPSKLVNEVSERPEESTSNLDHDPVGESETVAVSEQNAEPVVDTVEPEPEPEPEPEKPRPSLFQRLKASLGKTRSNLGSGFISLFKGKTIDDELYEDLETQLLMADVGMDTTQKIIDKLTDSAKRSDLKNAEALYGILKTQLHDLLLNVDQPLDSVMRTHDASEGPFVILMVGVNGVGKTTTIGKLAKQFQQQGKKVMLAAGDTFRAAAVEQLQVWGERNNIPVIAQPTGSDSASVLYDALESAKSKKMDVLIADTAGRLQNKDHLMEELKKVVRVMKKLNPEAPHEVMMALDAGTGQNAISQAKLFSQAVGLTGITLTKLDGTAKGGVIFSIADQFGIPIRYIGVGESIDDLRPFNSDEFIDALFSEQENKQ
ncbi:signal recognition particle-docking protein FtsY [Alteromonas sp. ASW11-130]|uniref:signal recognition particle-docking protein FtsY n=1 Tax=Alteromonas sp. ASW11-130 TaxID=3015775 RepID=UPI002241EC12|nr:signal recognition particle-docking protein FtsY [Alteromonas sp. ASW11-130]MCW8091941.1 signal recognition particle-docking protein FtsY [Alteromonas sp. ASW11-130]